jgi:hypothetical protein
MAPRRARVRRQCVKLRPQRRDGLGDPFQRLFQPFRSLVRIVASAAHEGSLAARRDSPPPPDFLALNPRKGLNVKHVAT